VIHDKIDARAASRNAGDGHGERRTQLERVPIARREFVPGRIDQAQIPFPLLEMK
jgi:hypothetical protein